MPYRSSKAEATASEDALCGFWLTDTDTLFSIEGLEQLIHEQLKGEDGE
jgi:hypothetical protein